MGVRIYIEGGGDRSNQKAMLRTGFGDFFRSLRERARSRSKTFNIVMCGSRLRTFSNFTTALQQYPNDLVILLVDSEDAVNGTPRDYLRRRESWHISSSSDENYHLMVRVMESWFLADKACLESYYGSDFKKTQLPGNPNVEDVSKQDVLDGLNTATVSTQKGRYKKIRHASDLLARIDPSEVRRVSPHCDRLFCAVENAL